MSEKEIQEILKARFEDKIARKGSAIGINNAYIFDNNWESDYCYLTKVGYINEIEIKCSYLDFQKDFKKEKHFIFDNYKNEYAYKKFPDKGYGTFLGTKPVRKKSLDGHYYTDHVSEYAKASKIKIIDLKKALFPNRYYFACPENIIPVDKIPHYAGLIYIIDSYPNIIKQAPLLHNRRLDIHSILSMKLYYKHSILEKAYNNLLADHEILTKNYEDLLQRSNLS